MIVLKVVLTKSKPKSDRKVTLAAHSLAARLLATRQKKRPRNFKFSVRWFVSRPRIDFPKGWQLLLITDANPQYGKIKGKKSSINWPLDVFSSSLVQKKALFAMIYIIWNFGYFLRPFELQEADNSARQSHVSFLWLFMSPNWWFRRRIRRRQGPKWASWKLGVGFFHGHVSKNFVLQRSKQPTFRLRCAHCAGNWNWIAFQVNLKKQATFTFNYW